MTPRVLTPAGCRYESPQALEVPPLAAAAGHFNFHDMTLALHKRNVPDLGPNATIPCLTLIR